MDATDNPPGLTPDQTGALRRWAGDKPRIAAIYVVGSRARGNYRPDSDLDLVIESTDASDEIGLSVYIREAGRWCSELTAATGLVVKDIWPDRASKDEAGHPWEGLLVYTTGGPNLIC